MLAEISGKKIIPKSGVLLIFGKWKGEKHQKGSLVLKGTLRGPYLAKLYDGFLTMISYQS
jgi:hypothetical protein